MISEVLMPSIKHGSMYIYTQRHSRKIIALFVVEKHDLEIKCDHYLTRAAGVC